MATKASSIAFKNLPVRSLAAAVAIGSTAALCAPAPVDVALRPVASSSSVSLLATQAAIMMNGTFTPDVTPEFAESVMYNYLKPLVGSGYTAVPLRTPESLWPLSGLTSLTYNESTRVGYQIVEAKYREIVRQNTSDGEPNTPMLVFGYSQSAFIASILDQTLGKEIKSGGQVPPTTFVLVGNTNVPNGGLFSRFNGLGLTPWTPVVFAPTATGSPTYDVFRQYDPFADFPAYPLNALAVVNSLMGYLLHFTLPVSGNPPWLNPVISILNKLITPISLNPESPNYIKPIVSQYQDTIYQFVPTAKLPILDPLRWIGLSKLADGLDPVLRPLIEAGYDRSTSFGVPTPAKFGLGPNLDAAFKQSWQALLHLIDPARHPAPAVAEAVKPAAVAAGAPVAVELGAVSTPEEPNPPQSAPVAAAPGPVGVEPPAAPQQDVTAPVVDDPTPGTAPASRGARLQPALLGADSAPTPAPAVAERPVRQSSSAARDTGQDSRDPGPSTARHARR